MNTIFKKIILAALLLVTSLNFAQEQNSEKQNVIKGNILGIFGRYYTISYERQVAEKSSAQLSVGIMGDMLDSDWLDSSSTDTSEFKSFYVIPEFRYYPAKGFGKGFYLSPYTRLNFVTLSQNSYSENYFQFNPGLLVGWQWVFGDEFSLDLGFGPEMITNKDLVLKDNAGYELISAEYPSVIPRISFSLGYKF